MRIRNWLATGLVALGVLAGCGAESTSSDDSGAAGAGTDGPECANDADCLNPEHPKCSDAGTCISEPCSTDADCQDPSFPKCTQAGQCAYQNYCETDADCRGDYKFCDTLHQCEPCRADADCPSETPFCVPGWEFGVYCAVCKYGDSSVCPAGTWCAQVFVAGGGGRCEVPNCGENPMGEPCLACVNENASGCLASGDECTDELANLRACHVAEVPGWTPDDCPTGVVPAERGCTPLACADEAEAMDACLLRCSAVTETCGT